MSRHAWNVTGVVVVIAGLLAGCRDRPVPVVGHGVREDGTYRGVFIDGDEVQVNVEFTLRNGIVQKASFRHLRYGEHFHMRTDQEPFRSVIGQHREALDHLVGKNLEAHLADLYHPRRIVKTEVDGFTAATLRGNKIISAIRDGLNRGVYSY